MSTQLITIGGVEKFALSADDSAFDRRDELALQAGVIQAVQNADQALKASALLKELANFTRLIEASRVEVKAPVLEVQRKIDKLAKDLAEHLQVEAGRVSKLLGAFNEQERARAEEARQRAWEEEQRILRAAEDKRQAEEAEAKRKADELAAKATKARNAENAAKYEEQARLVREQAEEAARKRDESTAEQIVQTRAASVVTAPKASGIATRRSVKFEVTDIHALYKARPELVKLEPNTVVINAAIKGLPNASIPGLRIWEESSAIVR